MYTGGFTTVHAPDNITSSSILGFVLCIRFLFSTLNYRSERRATIERQKIIDFKLAH